PHCPPEPAGAQPDGGVWPWRRCLAAPRGTRACLLRSWEFGMRWWVDEPTKRVVRRPVGDDPALAPRSAPLVGEAEAGSSAGGRGDHLPLPVRDRLARSPGRLRALADGVEASSGLGRRWDLGPHPGCAAGPCRRGW